MGWIFRRSVKLLPGVRLNFSKSGVGLSVGVPGARISLSPSGRVTRTLGIPGTGISHRKVLNSDAGSHEASQAFESAGDTNHSPPHTEAFATPFGSALAALQAGDLEHATSCLQAALTLPPEDGVVDVAIAPGLSVELPRDRDAALLLLSEINQAQGRRDLALQLLDQATPTTHALIAACEILLQTSRFDDVIDATEGLDLADESSGFGHVYRAIAQREVGRLNESAATLGNVIDRHLSVEVSGQALFERGLTHQAQGHTNASTADFASVPDAHWLHEAAQAMLGGRRTYRRWSETADDPEGGSELPPLELPD